MFKYLHKNLEQVEKLFVVILSSLKMKVIGR